MQKPRFLTITGMILLAALSRLVPHPWNVTPITAMALLGGARFEKSYQAFLVPLAALFLGDLVLGFYPGILFVYLAFAAVVLVGFWLRGKSGAGPVVGAALA